MILSRIWAAVVVGKDGNYTVTSGKIVGLFVGLLIIVCVPLAHPTKVLIPYIIFVSTEF